MVVFPFERFEILSRNIWIIENAHEDSQNFGVKTLLLDVKKAGN